MRLQPSVPTPSSDRRAVPHTVQNEAQWREPDSANALALTSKVIASRWTYAKHSIIEAQTETPTDRHVIGINLRHTQLSFSVNGRSLVSGRMIPGTMHMVAPGRRCAVRFDAPADVLHLQISQQILAECHEAAYGHLPAEAITIDDEALSLDPGIERLAHALLGNDSTGCPFGRLFEESVSLAIVTRVLARHLNPSQASVRKTTSLSKWRLDRAIDYIEANLAEPIALADVANTTGLTRMHFAAQFRAATGYRPHEYLLRRRIEQAQALLARPELTLVDAALSVGFQSQAHFSTVFKRLVGETPSRWRQMRQGASVSQRG